MKVYAGNSDLKDIFTNHINEQIENQMSENVCDQIPDGLVKLPKDDSLHKGLQEQWFYITTLVDENGRKFEVLGVVFKVYSAGTPYLIGESALYIDGKTLFQTSVSFIEPQKLKDGFSFDLGHVKLEGSNGHDSIYVSAGDYSIDIEITQVKAPVLHYQDGYLKPYYGGDIFYYTRPRSNATGVLTQGNTTYEVSGITYFDHLYGHLDPIINVGWDWFEMHLDDGVDIIIFLLKPEHSEVLIIDADCNYIPISGQDIKVKVLDTWVSPTTGCSYAHGWEFIIQGKKYILTPTTEDQEIMQHPKVRGGGVFNVTGDAVGRGFAELLGYCG